jgi:hypothetical protein
MAQRKTTKLDTYASLTSMLTDLRSREISVSTNLRYESDGTEREELRTRLASIRSERKQIRQQMRVMSRT